MKCSRQDLIDTLRRAGFHDAAEEAKVELPDPVPFERAQEWAMKRGITRDVLINLMGGSP